MRLLPFGENFQSANYLHLDMIALLRSTKFSYNIGLGSFRCLSGTITGMKVHENSLTSDNYR